MTMAPFFRRFPDLGMQEMRVVTVQSSQEIPDGEYGFLELYCEDPQCDCRRVLLDVVSPTSGAKIWATINYGWESPAYYATWAGSKEAAAGMSAGHSQSRD